MKLFQYTHDRLWPTELEVPDDLGIQLRIETDDGAVFKLRVTKDGELEIREASYRMLSLHLLQGNALSIEAVDRHGD